MKNIKTTFVQLISILLISVNGFSQSLTLEWEGEPIADTMIVTGLATDMEMVAHAIVSNNTDQSMDVKVRRNQLQMIDETLNQFCWGANCYPPNIDESPGFLTLTPGQSTEEEQFSGHYLPQGNYGDSFIEYEFFNMNNENENVKVIVQFVATTVGIDKNDLNINIYPNPASEYVAINSSNSIESVMVYNSAGTKLMEVGVNKSSILLNTSTLSSGLYFFRITTHNDVIIKQMMIK